MLLIIGAVLMAMGGLLLLGERFGLGKLPGDFVFRKKNLTVYMPIATSLLLSVALTIVLNLILRRK